MVCEFSFEFGRGGSGCGLPLEYSERISSGLSALLKFRIMKGSSLGNPFAFQLSNSAAPVGPVEASCKLPQPFAGNPERAFPCLSADSNMASTAVLDRAPRTFPKRYGGLLHNVLDVRHIRNQHRDVTKDFPSLRRNNERNRCCAAPGFSNGASNPATLK